MTVPLPDVTITVQSVDTTGAPTAFVAHFVRPLEDSSYRWYAPDGMTLQAWTPPPIGQTVDVAPMLQLP
jgi:hypothetical protein